MELRALCVIFILTLFSSVMTRAAAVGQQSAASNGSCEKSTQVDGDRTIIQLWSGACVDGKRDGPGVLELQVETRNASWPSPKGTQTGTMRWTTRQEGTVVADRMVGLACTLESRTQRGRDPVVIDPMPYCALAGASDLYAREPDGSWVLHSFAGKPKTKEIAFLPGTLEAESERQIAAARQGEAATVWRSLPAVSPLLEGLSPGGRVEFVPRLVESHVPKPIFLDKRIALIASNRTLASFDRFVAARNDFLEESAAVVATQATPSNSWSIVDERQALIAASDPTRLFRALAERIRGGAAGSAAAIEAVPDLTRLAAGEFDYALILDVEASSAFDQLGRYQEVPVAKPGQKYYGPVLAVFSIGGLVLDRELRVVRVFPADKTEAIKDTPCEHSSRTSDCNLRYIFDLRMFFENNFSMPNRFSDLYR